MWRSPACRTRAGPTEARPRPAKDGLAGTDREGFPPMRSHSLGLLGLGRRSRGCHGSVDSPARSSGSRRPLPSSAPPIPVWNLLVSLPRLCQGHLREGMRKLDFFCCVLALISQPAQFQHDKGSVLAHRSSENTPNSQCAVLCFPSSKSNV